MSEYGEPWRVNRGIGAGLEVRRSDGSVLWLDEEAWRRIVAAVNACAGLSDAALAAGVVGRMAALLRADEWTDNCYQYAVCRECGDGWAEASQEAHEPDCERGQVLALLGSGGASALAGEAG